MKRNLVATIVTLVSVAMCIGILVGCAAPTPAPAPAPTPVEKIEWKAHGVLPIGNYIIEELHKPFCDEVYRRTEGRLDIKFYPGGELGYKGGDMLRHLRDGIVEASEVLPVYCGGDVPWTGIVQLPFIMGTLEEARPAYDAYNRILARELEKSWNTLVLYNGPFPPQQMFTKGKRITSLEDFKALKIRVYAKEHSDAMKILGAVPITMEWGEVYTALQRGTVDGALTSFMTAKDSKMYEVLDYSNVINFNIPDEGFYVSKEAFTRLPADIQDILVELGKEYYEKFWVETAKYHTLDRILVEERGMETVEMPSDVRQQMVDMMKPIWTGALEKGGALAKEVFDAVQKP